MGLFTQKPQEPSAWAALPGEPLETSASERLDEAPPVDPMDIGVGAQYSTVVFPVKAPAPEATDVATEGEK